MKRLITAALLAWTLPAAAWAQSIPGCPPFAAVGCVGLQSFIPAGSATLAASNVTGNVALGVAGSYVLVTNAGPATAYVALGGSTVTATTASIPIPIYGQLALSVGSNTYLAGITAASTAALTVQTGTGVPIVANISGAVNDVLGASSAIIGKVGIDQTTPGTTNGVQVTAALPAGANLIGKTGIDQTTPGTTNGVQVNAALPAGTNLIGSVTSTVSAAITNPTSVLTRPSNTTNYAQNNLVASSVTAGSVVVPSFAIANSAGAVAIPRLRLATNKTAGWDTVALRVRLWSAANTYTNGDGGAYAVATGSANLLGQFDVSLTQFSDGATGFGTPSVGTAAWIKLASGTSIFWDVQYIGSAALTPASGQTFTLTAELAN